MTMPPRALAALLFLLPVSAQATVLFDRCRFVATLQEPVARLADEFIAGLSTVKPFPEEEVPGVRAEFIARVEELRWVMHLGRQYMALSEAIETLRAGVEQPRSMADLVKTLPARFAAVAAWLDDAFAGDAYRWTPHELAQLASLAGRVAVLLEAESDFLQELRERAALGAPLRGSLETPAVLAHLENIRLADRMLFPRLRRRRDDTTVAIVRRLAQSEARPMRLLTPFLVQHLAFLDGYALEQPWVNRELWNGIRSIAHCLSVDRIGFP